MIDESRMKSLKVEKELLAVSHIRRLEKEIDEFNQTKNLCSRRTREDEEGRI